MSVRLNLSVSVKRSTMSAARASRDALMLHMVQDERVASEQKPALKGVEGRPAANENAKILHDNNHHITPPPVERRS
jgi:hypothetical protein